jgi:hypothetical protein
MLEYKFYWTVHEITVEVRIILHLLQQQLASDTISTRKTYILLF